MATVSNGQYLTIGAGQTSTGLTVDPSGFLTVDAGGRAVDTTNSGTTLVSGGSIVSTSDYGGDDIVYTGGTTTNTFVYSQGNELLSGGTASGTDLVYGFQTVLGGGVASTTLVGGTGATLGDMVVSSGGRAVNANVRQNGEQVVSAGGTATGTILASGGTLDVYGGVASNVTGSGNVVVSGGSITGLTLSSGSELSISGGTVTNLTLTAGTTIDFQADPYASGATASYNAAANLLTISEGGKTYTQSLSGTYTGDGFFVAPAGTGTLVSIQSAVFVSAGVTSSNLTAQNGEVVVVLSGGTTSNITLSSGSTEFVSSGGHAYATTVSANASQVVSFGGTASGTDLQAGGSEGVLGTTSATTVLSGGFQYVSAGGHALLTVVSSGGGQDVLSGGLASSASLLAGATQTVASGGHAIDTIVNGNSTGSNSMLGQLLFNGATATGTVLRSYGTFSAFSSGVASDTVISSLGSGFVYSGGETVSTTVSSGGYEFVSAGGIALDTTVSRGGYQVVSGTVSGTTYVAADVTANVSGTVLLSGGTLELFSSGVAVGTHLEGGAIDVEYLPYMAGGTASLNSATDVLTVKEGTQTYTQTLSGTYTGFAFHLAPAVDGSTLITACYCAGTLITTTRGDVPVETLAIGDVVITAFGEQRPIRWIGCRSYSGRFLTANPTAQPIRFRAGSLGANLPRRDLLVSPEHAMFLDGLLIPARCLLTGSTIVQERGLERADYFHVELETHDVLLAEGAASESFMDDDSRGIFHNAAEFAELYPDVRKPAGFCAARVEYGAELEAVRRRLADVAGQEVAAA